MWSPEFLFLVALTFLFGGFLKGGLGLGLPLVALAGIAPVMGVKIAMAVMLVPCIVMNAWQAVSGGNLRAILQRLWLFLVMSAIGIWFGVQILAVANAAAITLTLGVILALYSVFSLTRPQIPPPGRHEPWMGPVSGGLGGLAFGITGTFIVPGILFVQALGFDRNRLVQAMGVCFVVISSVLALSMSRNNLLPTDLAVLSTLALVPTAAGWWLGRLLRDRVPEEIFRKLFFAGLMLVGFYMIFRGFSGLHA